MDNIIYDLIGKSDVTLIGYTYKVERIKDELISKIPCYKLGEISSSFSLKSIIRDIKLNQILEDESFKYFKYIILDIGDVVNNDNKKLDTIGRNELVELITRNIRNEMMNLCGEVYRLIITTPLNRSLINSSDPLGVTNFTGGSKPLFMSDVAFIIQEPNIATNSTIKIIKNRHGIMRDSISLDGLKEYKYNEISNK